MAVKSLWLACVLAAFAIFVIVETSASKETRASEDYQDLKTYDVKTKGKELKLKKSNESINGKDAGSFEARGKAIPKKYRIVLMRTKSKNPDDEEYRLPTDKIIEEVSQIGERYKDRVKRNATVLKEFKDAKKSQKKLKLARSRTGYKNWENKGESLDKTQKKINRRRVDHLVDNNDGLERSKRYAATRSFKDEKYYAQRKAIMDKFYARQKEIAEKYARKASTTPKYAYRYHLGKETEKNYVSPTVQTITDKMEEPGSAITGLGTGTTTAPSMEDEQIEETVTVASRGSGTNLVEITDNLSDDNVEDDVSDDYDYYALEDKYKSVAEAAFDQNGTMSDGKWKAGESRIGTMTWGSCKGKLVYVHNLIIDVPITGYAGGSISTMLVVPYCVTCINVEPLNKSKARVAFNVSRNSDDGYSKAILTFEGVQGEQLRYTVTMWAVNRNNDRCDV